MNAIEIIPIAKKKLKKRNISEDWILKTIKFPNHVVDGYGGRKVAHRIYTINDKKYLLRVIYEERDKTKIVISAYLTSQINRYWREKNENWI